MRSITGIIVERTDAREQKRKEYQIKEHER